MPNFVLSTRAVRRKKFIPEPGKPVYLSVHGDEVPDPGHKITRAAWVFGVMEAAGTDGVLVWVHGYNNGPQIVIERHRALAELLAHCDWNGVVVSYDWPAAEVALNYLEDRRDAKRTAWHLVDGGIRLFTTQQRRGCEIPVHILAHSAGAYVVREAFDDADDRLCLAMDNWSVSQVLLIGADISRRSMERGGRASSLYRHCVRLTNYQTPQDSALALSGVKRAGTAPRAGRVGLPDDIPPNAVNVNCAWRYSALDRALDDASSHSWYFSDTHWALDAAWTLCGDIDRNHIPTRVMKEDQLWLTNP